MAGTGALHPYEAIYHRKMGGDELG
jgi:hypothetical protein